MARSILQPRERKCQGLCTGYGTCTNCPPLIVLAVLLRDGYALSLPCFLTEAIQ